MFYASFINSNWSYAPKITGVMSIIALGLGVTALVKVEINVLVAVLLVVTIFLYMAIDGMIKPFLYRKSVQAVYEYKRDPHPVRTNKGGCYIRVYMVYEYEGVQYREFLISIFSTLYFTQSKRSRYRSGSG